MQYTTYLCDELENIQSISDYTTVPAAWMEPLLALEVYEAQLLTAGRYYTHSWLSDEVTAMTAAELFSEDTFLGGCASREHLDFLGERPNGERVMASCTADEANEWKIAFSTPLLQRVSYGYENFTSALVSGELLVSVDMIEQDTCGITHIYNIAESVSEGEMFTLGKNWIAGASITGYEHCCGDHLGSDITTVDWNSLPGSFEEALAVMDTLAWAVVNNPDPEDRLHLRAETEGAKSLGKYYNGTPVRITEQKGDWVHVELFGINGWMMKRYLVFGDAAHAGGKPKRPLSVCSTRST